MYMYMYTCCIISTYTCIARALLQTLVHVLVLFIYIYMYTVLVQMYMCIAVQPHCVTFKLVHVHVHVGMMSVLTEWRHGLLLG